MTIVEAIVLGLIQGLSEFLPISSTAHLTLAGRAMGLIDPTAPHKWTEFIAVIQLGTLVAVLVYFARDIAAITSAFVRENVQRVPLRQQTFNARSGWFIIIGTIPIVVIGLLFKDVIEGSGTKNLIVIGTSLIVLAIILEIAERVARFTRTIDQMTVRDALFIGIAQAVALVPGASRSGTTLTAGLFAGLTREAAARFSFLISIPAIAASGLYEFFEVIEHVDRSGLVKLAVATIVSAVSGYAAISFLLRYLRTRTTRLFVVYRLVIGGAILAAIALDWIES
ncbi:MAG: undecaprenyl-diphosphatase UppP [bacterium]|nr:undecaprenyl-diphosphatase UppP [Candidatus Kapabacteria bacterium]